ncbi:hypothetical protein EUGRSUZ_H02884 [Eucalyptus grandis]|uniref:Uncharacterized protein n=2 Tax=Eucalyptus grandis TaxID=71139 RepID=A0ACC3JST5_EUCGR|nr:hypothetical protein EUGRSUZ_H02884 [Eucalyptus grandis]
MRNSTINYKSSVCSNTKLIPGPHFSTCVGNKKSFNALVSQIDCQLNHATSTTTVTLRNLPVPNSLR